MATKLGGLNFMFPGLTHPLTSKVSEFATGTTNHHAQSSSKVTFMDWNVGECLRRIKRKTWVCAAADTFRRKA